MAYVINEAVSVNAFYFSTGKELKTFPRQIEYAGRAVTFVSGLRCLIRRGGEASCLFTMNDAEGANYRLRQEGNSWTLVGYN